jgi:hypothetical protein
VNVANTYVVALVQDIKRKHSLEIEAFAGSTKHLDGMLGLCLNCSDNFLVITLKDVIALPSMTGDM